MTVVVNSRDDLTLENYRRVAMGGEPVTIGPEARRTMAAGRADFLRLLESDRTQYIYGVTSSFGPRAKLTIPPDQQRCPPPSRRTPPCRPATGWTMPSRSSRCRWRRSAPRSTRTMTCSMTSGATRTRHWRWRRCAAIWRAPPPAAGGLLRCPFVRSVFPPIDGTGERDLSADGGRLQRALGAARSGELAAAEPISSPRRSTGTAAR